MKERKPDRQVVTMEDDLIRDVPPPRDETKDVWPAKRKKLLLKHLGHDVSKLTNQEIDIKLKEVISKFTPKKKR